MKQKCITKAELTDVVYKFLGVSRRESAELVMDILEEITQDLEKGNTVKINSFGSFRAIKKNQRPGRNPKTGEKVNIEPRTAVSFRASSNLRKRINGYSV